MESGKGLTQEFHGNVSQVAAGDIYNFYGGQVVPAVKPELRRAIGGLLSTCDPCNQRKLIEKISLKSFGTTDFKSLDIKDVFWLTDVAQDIASAIDNAVLDQQRSTAREEDEFQKEYGILASAPAREALKLLVQQNLTTKQVAQAWKSGMLSFDDKHQFSIKISRSGKVFGMFMLVLGVTLAVPSYFLGPALDAFAPGAVQSFGIKGYLIIVGSTLGAAIFFSLLGASILSSYHSVGLVAKHIKKVNAMLRKQKRLDSSRK